MAEGSATYLLIVENQSWLLDMYCMYWCVTIMHGPCPCMTMAHPTSQTRRCLLPFSLQGLNNRLLFVRQLPQWSGFGRKKVFVLCALFRLGTPHHYKQTGTRMYGPIARFLFLLPTECPHRQVSGQPCVEKEVVVVRETVEQADSKLTCPVPCPCN